MTALHYDESAFLIPVAGGKEVGAPVDLDFATECKGAVTASGRLFLMRYDPDDYSEDRFEVVAYDPAQGVDESTRVPRGFGRILFQPAGESMEILRPLVDCSTSLST